MTKDFINQPLNDLVITVFEGLGFITLHPMQVLTHPLADCRLNFVLKRVNSKSDYIGVIVGLRNSTGTPVGTLAASTAGYMTVCIDPMAILRVQCDDGGTAITSAAREISSGSARTTAPRPVGRFRSE